MTQKSRTSSDIITAIDLGSSHCLTLMASRDATSGELRIVGVGNVPSKGIKRAGIINLEEAIETLEQSVAMAEKVCGHNVGSVYMNVSGQHISSMNSSGVVVVADANNEIGEDDIDRVVEAARAVSLPADREVLNLTPRFFTVDGQEGIKDPMRMVGMRLEVDVHIITSSSSALRNLEKALSDVGLAKETFVFSGYAASEVVLSSTEKDAGAVCIDIGADTTSFCVYMDGAITLSGVVPIGGRYITQDINAYTRVGLENAEKIKITLGEGMNEVPPQHKDESKEEYRRRLKSVDILNLAQYDPNVKPATISRTVLIRSVIIPRVKEIFSLIDEQLRRHKFAGKLGAGAVVVGGGAKTVGLIETAGRTLGTQVRVGVPEGIQGVIRHIDDPTYATAIGLLHYAQKEQQTQVELGGKNALKQPALDDLFAKVGRLFKKFMPP
jgi:cell division protein FtsA